MTITISVTLDEDGQTVASSECPAVSWISDDPKRAIDFVKGGVLAALANWEPVPDEIRFEVRR